MKFVARFFLFLFISFLSTPTIVKLIEKPSGKIIFCAVSEEEHVKKEVKNLLYIVDSNATFELKSTDFTGLILSDNLSKQDNISRSIVTPPPDNV